MFLEEIRKLIVRAPQAKPAALAGRKIVVTGCAPGSLGYATAQTLAAWGACVIVTSRSNPEAVLAQLVADNPAAAARLDCHSLDLCQAGSVARFADWYEDQHGQQLDVLINNAGIHLDLLSKFDQPSLSADGHEIQWRTNYLGTMHLTHLLLPLLKRTGKERGDARIINVVSELHTKGANADLFGIKRPYNSWQAYGNSKLALVHASFEIQKRYAKQYNLQAYCLHPGPVYTNIAGKGLADSGLIERLRNRCAPLERFMLLTPEEGAQTTIHCAAQPDLRGGLYYRSCRPARTSSESQHADVSRRLWEETAGWVQGL